MEILSEPKLKTAYYFTSSDHEILDDYLLNLSCDEDTWLYKVGDLTFINQYEHFKSDPSLQDQFKQPSRGFIDGRTFTRRKLRQSLDSVIESPLSNNRSSLGILNQSKLLNDSLIPHPLQDQENQDKSSSNCTVSDLKGTAPRVFKLDTPLMNMASLEIKNRTLSRNLTFDRKIIDSECSDSSLPHSLNQINSFDQNCTITASLTNCLEKNEIGYPPPTAFEDDGGMTNSIISLSGNHEDITGKDGQMTDSLVGFLEHVNCKPPSGFEDNEVEIHHDPGLYLSNHKKKHVINDIENHATNNLISGISTNTTTSIKNENTLLESKILGKLQAENDCNGRSALIHKLENKYLPNYGTYKIGTNKDSILVRNGGKEPNHSVSINSSILSRNGRKLEELKEDKTNTLSTDKETYDSISTESTERNIRGKPFNNRDLNVSSEIYSDEENEFVATKTFSNKSVPINNNKVNTTFNRNNTFSKNDNVETSVRQIPLKNSTFNTTFTKLEAPGSKGMDSTFVKSMDGLNGGLDDDQTSSASDSSFSSCSTKPRSVDELRSIAQQQENSLVQQTSTPTEENLKRQSSNLAKLNIELSPIRRVSTGDSRANESRSANCSPVRRPDHKSPNYHPISRMQQPVVEARRQMLQASSLSNIARPKSSGLRLPQPLNRYVSATDTTFTRPSTAPIPAHTAIPRPQVSRLPQPRKRGTSIPGPKRGGIH